MSSLDDFRDNMALKAYGKTRSVAWGTGTCIRCNHHVQPDQWTVEDRGEYYLSALCPSCYQKVFEDFSD